MFGITIVRKCFRKVLPEVVFENVSESPEHLWTMFEHFGVVPISGMVLPKPGMGSARIQTPPGEAIGADA